MSSGGRRFQGANVAPISATAAQLAIVAVVSFFFDMMLVDHRRAVDRISSCIRDVLEPQIANHQSWDSSSLLWERYRRDNKPLPSSFVVNTDSPPTTSVVVVLGIVGIFSELDGTVAVVESLCCRRSSLSTC